MTTFFILLVMKGHSGGSENLRGFCPITVFAYKSVIYNQKRPKFKILI